jgi:hypothetical protein
MLLGKLDRGVHDGRHRVDADQHREATAGEADDRSARRQDLAELVRVFAAEGLAAIVAERARDPVERVELAEQQTGKPSLLPLLQEFLDESDTRAAALRRSVSPRDEPALRLPHLPVSKLFQQNHDLTAVRGVTRARRASATERTSSQARQFLTADVTALA